MAESGLRVGVAGLGAIGLEVARRLDAGVEDLRLVAVSARDRDKAVRTLAPFRAPPPVVDLPALAQAADVVVECVPAAAFAAAAEPAIEAGRLFMPLSAAQLLERPDLVERAKRTGARILVPTGALLGLDAVRAAAESRIDSVRMRTRKPPAGLKGAPHVERNAISLDGLTAPLRIFAGSAREAARGFPANVNVAAALSLAGIGPDRTIVEIWADPTVSRNIHEIEVEADSARLSLRIENVPSENPRTGRITALSVIAALRGLVSPLKVGT
jgi:aspartate dehydrogenase